MRQDTIKLLEENIGKTFSDTNRTNVFLGQCTKAIEIKTSQWDLFKLTRLCTAKETIWKKKKKDNQQNVRKQLQTMQPTRALSPKYTNRSSLRGSVVNKSN